MRSLMVVVPDKLLDSTTAGAERKQRPYVQALVIDGSKEPFDFAIRLWRVGPQQVMRDAAGRADLLEASQAISVQRMAHRKREGVVGQDRLDAIRQRCGDVLE